MRLIREARRFECENQRRESRRSQLKKWLDLSHQDVDECPEDEKQRHHVRRAPFSLPIIRRTTPVSPLAPSLKRSQTPLAVKWTSCFKAIGRKDMQKTQRRVKFLENEVEEYERPEVTKEEKATYHYSATELGEMETIAKQFVHRESRFAGQPRDTILEQGFLSLRMQAPFFQSKRYYCLLRGHSLQLYSSAVHATKKTSNKTEMTILRVQDCQTLTMKKKFALFGAHLPTQICQMFYVIKTNGERVIFTADTKSSKRNWLHSLTRLTYVGEGDGYTLTSRLRPRASSAPSSCILPSVPEGEIEEDACDDMTTLVPPKLDRRNSCR